MVCLGNICRSPLAQGILESKLPKNQYFIDSAGTSNYHPGKSPDYRSIAEAKKHGLDLSHQKARQITSDDLTEFDHIYVMDTSNLRDVLALASSDKEKKKVQLILHAADLGLKDVPDPYYGGTEGFEHVYDLLDKATDTIAKAFLN